jgi:hypothetical protein
MRIKVGALAVACTVALAGLVSAGPITVTQTTNGTTLGAALAGTGVTITSAAVTSGASSQVGTYTNFSLIGNGVVLSSGQVVQVGPAFNNGVQGTNTTPSSDTGQAGTTEFDAYGPGHVANFSGSYDVAGLQVTFTLATDSQVAFDFVFGSVEYPQYTSSYTDAFLAFLDNTTNQVSFDALNQAVQVGSTFASALIKTNNETAFGDPHGLLQLTTITSLLTAGSHTLLFEVGDVNDHILDSAVFLSNIHTTTGTPGTGTTVPEPGTMILLGTGLLGVARAWRKRQH